MAGDLKPGDVTTLGALRPGDVDGAWPHQPPLPLFIESCLSSPNALAWTDAKPTVPGWYWHRYGPRDGDAPTVVEIAIHPKRAKLMTVWAAHSTDDWTELLEGQFAGPIPLPTEAKWW